MTALHEVPITEVPCTAGATLQFDWGLGGSLDLCSTGENATATRYDWQTLGYAERRPAHSLAPLFTELQSAKQTGKSAATQYQEISEYADRVSASLIRDMTNEDLPDDDSMLQLYHERGVWELLRICCLDARQQECVTHALAVWLRRFHTLYSSLTELPMHSEIARMTKLAIPEEDSQYWPVVQRLVALGRLEEAVDLLGAHSIWTTSYQSQQQQPTLLAEFTLVETLTMLLRRSPRFAASTDDLGGQPFPDRTTFAEARGLWQTQVRALLADQGLWRRAAEQSESTAIGLQQVAAILCGSPECVSQGASTWLELLIAQLQHLYPDLPLQAHLSTLLQRCLQEKGALEGWLPATVQELLEAIGEQNIQSLVQICSARMSPWMPAHLPDLLQLHPAAARVLDQDLQHLGCSQVEFFRLEYAAALAGGPTTWQLATQYLPWCPHHGEAVTAAILHKVGAAADRKAAAEVLRIAKQFDLLDVATRVCHMQGANALQAGRVAEALEWLLRLDDLLPANAAAATMLPRIRDAFADPSLLSAVVKELEDLESILRAANGSESAANGNNGTQPHSSDTLAFLQQLLLFLRGVQGEEKGSKAQACQALKALLSNANFKLLTGSQRLQPSTAVELLFHAIPLMEQSPPSFSFQDAQFLLQTLQELQWTAGAAALQQGAEETVETSISMSSKLHAVNLALARLLARTHMYEAS